MFSYRNLNSLLARSSSNIFSRNYQKFHFPKAPFRTMASTASPANAAASPQSVNQMKLAHYPSTKFGPKDADIMRRIIGTVDMTGKGTNHPVEKQADPFVFLDESVRPPGRRNNFGAHPHTGIVANTIPLNETFASNLWDNIVGDAGTLFADGLLQIKSGRGIVHDEGREVPQAELEARFGKEKLKHELETLKVGGHWLQLWFNPGIGKGAELQAPEARVYEGKEIRKIENSENTRVLIGEYKGVQGAGKTHGAEILVLDCKLDGESDKLEIDLPENYSTAFVYSVKNFNNANIRVQDLAKNPNSTITASEGVLLGERELAIRETTGSDGVKSNQGTKTKLENNKLLVELVDADGTNTKASARFIIGAGVPHNSPWKKMLGNDGALLGPTEDFVKSKMAEFESDRDRFGLGVEKKAKM